MDRSYVTMEPRRLVPDKPVFDITISLHVKSMHWDLFFGCPPTTYITRDPDSSARDFSNPAKRRHFWGGIYPPGTARTDYHWDGVELPGSGIWYLHIEFHPDHESDPDRSRRKWARSYTMSKTMNGDGTSASESLQLPAEYLSNSCTEWVLVREQRDAKIES